MGLPALVHTHTASQASRRPIAWNACVTGEYSVHFDGLLPLLTREAPTYFERDGKRYLFTSGTSGYYPNPSKVCMFTDLHGEYTDLGDPCIGDKSGTTFSAPITSVIRLPGTEQRHRENTSISRYVWLPIEWQGDKPVLRWRDEWGTEDLR